MEAECVVCLQLYDEGDHTPRVLSCGHSVCHSCAADLISRWGGGNAIGAQLLRCAECKQHTKVPLGGILALPKNIELMRLVQGKPRTPIGNSVDESKNPRLVKANRRPPRQCDEDRESSDPCLVSEPRFGAPAIWILPQAAITKRADVAGGISVGEFLRGKKVHSVSLQFFSRIAPENRDRGLNYTELVRLAWNSLHHEVRGKLMRLVLLSCKFLAEVAGLWMSEEGAVFLVSKVYVEGIQQARSLFCPTEKGEGSSLKEYGVGRISVTTLIRLGLELCEVLLEVHAAGVVVGILDMNAFVLDSYGHLQVHVGSFLFWRRFVGAIPSCSKANSCISSLGVGVLALEKVDEAIGSSYESLSPEVLQIIKRFEDGNASSSCGEAEKAAVTPKADVWSLGYILLRLLSQQGILERNERFKEQLLNCMASVPSDRPRVVDVWWELKGLLEDQALGIPSDLGEESSEGKLDLCEDGSKVGKPHADDSTIEPGTSSEASADALEDPQPDAPRLSRALVDVDQGIGEVKTLRGHMDTISCLSVCGNYLISASFDKTLRVWSLNDYRLIQTFEGHEQRITALAVHEASELCVSGDYAGHICAWKLASPDNSAPVVTWQEHQDWRYSGVASLAISNDELLYSGSGDRTIKAWSTLGFKHVATMEGHKGVVSALMVEGQFLFSGSWDGTIRLWWRPDHSPLVSFGGGLSVPLCGIRVLVKSPASGLLFSGHDSGVIQIWNEEECVGTLKAHTGVVSALAFDQDWLYSSSWDGFVKAWPLEDILSGTSNPIERKCNQAAVTALCCSVQDKLFVGIKQEIQVYTHEVLM